MLKKSKNDQMRFSFMDVIVIIIISVAIGSILGSSITYKKNNLKITNKSEELEEFINTYNNINKNYYKKVDKQKLIDKAIEGMINSLDDPYSFYMDENVTDSFNETVDGEYAGIGLTVSINEEDLDITEVKKNSPAKKAGLKQGDKIIEIEGKEIKGMTYEDVVKLIRGKENTKVQLVVLQGKKKKTINLVRKKIDISSVESKMIEKEGKKIGYIQVSVFAANTYKQFKNKLVDLENQKIESLIIDVRNNPGGHLNQVTDILELFLDKKKVLYQIEKKQKKRKIYANTQEKRTYKIVVLINKNSASASELLAAAMKESYKSKIVGVNSYGKGTIQNAYELKDGTSLKYTTQKWLTPEGNWINEKGIEPTDEVILSETYEKDPIESNDNQLQKALEIIIKESK